MPVIKLDYTNTKVTDTFARSDYPTANNNSNALLTIGKSGANITIAYLKFDFGLIPNNAIINSATLTLATGGTNTSIPINAHAVLNDFDITSLNWDNKPIYEEEISGSVPSIPTGSATSFSMDITSIVQKISKGTAYGIALESVDALNNITLSSVENSGNAQRPFLTIDYTIPTTDKKQVEFIEKTEAYTSGTPKLEIPITSNKKSGDVLVAYIQTSGNSQKIIDPVGWNVLYSNAKISFNSYLHVFCKVSDGTETILSTTTVNNSDVVCMASMHVYRNVKNIYAGETSKVFASNAVIYPNPPTNLTQNSLLCIFNAITGAGGLQSVPLNFKSEHVKSETIANFVSSTYNYNKTTYTADELSTRISSGYASGSVAISLEPITNEAPHIDGVNGDLGALSSPLVKPYTVTDTENNTITITEKLNGSVIRTFTGSGEQTLNLTAQWASLPVGKHTVTIEANDDYNNPPHTPTIRTWTFLKILPNTATLAESVLGLHQVVPYLQSQKAILGIALRGKGIAVNDTDRLEDMAKTLSTSSAVGRKVSGSVTSGTSLVFKYTTDATLNLPNITVTGLPFKPSFIFAFSKQYDNAVIYSKDYDRYYNPTAKVFSYSANSISAASYNIKADASPAYVNDTEFLLPVNNALTDYTWIAIE